MRSLVTTPRALPAVLVLTVTVAACAPTGFGVPDARALPPEPIMGAPRLPAADLAAWFERRRPQPGGRYAAAVPVSELARYFVEEGIAEGVTGDIAFVQAVVETGWFRFPGRVPASAHNFGGIGAATDSAPARFPDARTGVRAQIQHLRAYADPAATSCTSPPLRRPCADPRFHLVAPKGRARTWNELGRGNWAQARDYAAQILRLYAEARALR